MFAEAIKRIERQYEIKRNQADALFISEKKAIYDSTPKLSEIDKAITKLGIQTAKISLRPSTAETQKEILNLQSEILALKSEKEILHLFLSILVTNAMTLGMCFQMVLAKCVLVCAKNF